jgi:hypothetical protein
MPFQPENIASVNDSLHAEVLNLADSDNPSDFDNSLPLRQSKFTKILATRFGKNFYAFARMFPPAIFSGFHCFYI